MTRSPGGETATHLLPAPSSVYIKCILKEVDFDTGACVDETDDVFPNQVDGGLRAVK
jgi:hypothetical protein